MIIHSILMALALGVGALRSASAQNDDKEPVHPPSLPKLESLKPCGLQGAVAERIADCQSVNPFPPPASWAFDPGRTPPPAWILVAHTEAGKTVWKDPGPHGLFWSDSIGDMKFNEIPEDICRMPVSQAARADLGPSEIHWRLPQVSECQSAFLNAYEVLLHTPNLDIWTEFGALWCHCQLGDEDFRLCLEYGSGYTNDLLWNKRLAVRCAGRP